MKPKKLTYADLLHLYKMEHKKLCALKHALEKNTITASEACDGSAQTFLNKVNDKISDAVREGYTDCHIITGEHSTPNRFVIQKLINDGYDISYEHFSRDNTWFVIVSWSESCGRVFKIDLYDGIKKSTIDEMYSE